MPKERYMKTTTREAAEEQAVTTTMRAVRIHEYGGPEALKYEEIPRPKPQKDNVLVRIHAAGVNPVDVKIRQGSARNWLKFTLPITLGFDLSGVVEAVGAGVTKLKKGDEVYGRLEFTRIGSYAEYAIANESEVAPKPSSIDHVHAAAIPVAALAAWKALIDTAKLSAGQTVLIHGGAGGVGHFAVQIAKWKGATVIATASGDDVNFVKQLGAQQVIDYKALRFEDVVCSLDVVLDLIGGETQERSLKTLKPDGILVSTVGIADEEAPKKYGVRAEAITGHPDPQALSEIARLVDEERIRPVVSAEMPLEEAATAHEMIQTGGVRGKIVLKVRD